MSSAEDRSERHARVLGRLAELGLAAAEDLQGRLAAARDAAEAERLAMAFHRVSRCVRLTLALESKLARERCEIDKAERGAASVRTEARRKQVRAVLVREIWRECERETAEGLTAALDVRLKVETLFEGFLDGPVETVIDRLREELGLKDVGSANDAGRAQSAPLPWRSSA